MLVEIVTVTVLLSSVVTGQTEDFEQECSILKTLDDLEARLQQQEARLEQQEVHLKNQTTQLQQQEVQLKNQTTQLQQQEALLKNQTALLQEQEAEIAALKQEQTGPVVFMAKHVSTTSPGLNTLLVFTQVDTNIGNGYDSSTGMFTVPVAGTYSFYIQLCTFNQKHAIIGLYVNSIRKTGILTYGNSGHACQAFSYPAVLKQGDKVQAKIDHIHIHDSGQILSQDSFRVNSFSGALMR